MAWHTSDGDLLSWDAVFARPRPFGSLAVDARRAPEERCKRVATVVCPGGYIRVFCSCDACRALLRGRDVSDLRPLASFTSPSSGGSDSGLDVAVRGLDGGLSSSIMELGVLSRPELLADWILTWVLSWGSRGLFGDRADELRTCSQNCS